MKDAAPFFDIKNAETPEPKMNVTVGNEYVKNPGSSAVAGGNFKAHYGDQRVPHPTNTRAKETPKAKVMGQVLRAK